MRIALIFSGGGAKGAYQIGAWRALIDSGVSKYIKTISATSIGAINAILCTTYNEDYVINFWLNLTREKIAPIVFKDIINMLRRQSICSKENLISLISQILDYDTIKDSDIDILVTCSNLKFGYPKREVFNLKKNLDNAVDIVAATCSIPCVFKHQKINGNGIYFDGGINSRTPIDALDKDLFDYIIVIHNDNLGRLNFIKYSGNNIINIYPSSFQGLIFTGTYGFVNNIVDNKIQKGYKDTINIIKRYGLDRGVNE